MGKFGFSKWSYKRALGISTAKQKLSRAIGIPLTRSGRQRKIGRVLGSVLWPLALLSPRRAQQPGTTTVPTADAQSPATVHATPTLASAALGCFVLLAGAGVFAFAVFVVGGLAISYMTPTVRTERPTVARAATAHDQPAPVTHAVVEDRTPSQVEQINSVRTWTSADGRFTTEAAFAWATGEVVALRKSDGTIVRVAKDKLSEDDLAFVEQQKKR